MRLFMVAILILQFSCTGAIDTLGKVNGSDQARHRGPDERPSDGSEGVPGYLTELALISFTRIGDLIEVRGYPGAVKITNNFVDFYINVLQIPRRGFFEASTELEKIDQATAQAAPSQGQADWGGEAGQRAPEEPDDRNNPTIGQNQERDPEPKENGSGGENAGDDRNGDGDDSGGGALRLSGNAQRA